MLEREKHNLIYYIIKENSRKITGVTLLRKLTFVPFAEFIVILMCFLFVLSFYRLVVYVLIFLSASGLRVNCFDQQGIFVPCV